MCLPLPRLWKKWLCQLEITRDATVMETRRRLVRKVPGYGAISARLPRMPHLLLSQLLSAFVYKSYSFQSVCKKTKAIRRFLTSTRTCLLPPVAVNLWSHLSLYVKQLHSCRRPATHFILGPICAGPVRTWTQHFSPFSL